MEALGVYCSGFEEIPGNCCVMIEVQHALEVRLRRSEAIIFEIVDTSYSNETI